MDLGNEKCVIHKKEKIILTKLLGGGAYGKVYKASKHNKSIAVK